MQKQRRGCEKINRKNDMGTREKNRYKGYEMEKIKEIIKEKKFKYICFFWSIISIQFILGGNLQSKGHICTSKSQVLLNIFMFIFMTVIFIALHYSILEIYNRKKVIKEKKETVVKNKQQEKSKDTVFNKVINKIKGTKHKGILYFLIIFVCWIPTVLAFYPAIVAYDGGNQIIGYLFEHKMMHHPILITKLYSTFYLIGIKLESATIGMFFFSLFQMTFMAVSFSNTVVFIEEQTNKKWVRNISILFYALFPYNQLFAITTTKDVIFAGFVLIFLINLYRNLLKKFKIVDYVFLILIGVLMLLSRNNSIYMLEVSLPFVIIVLIKEKKKMLKIAALFLIIIISYKCANKLIYEKNNTETIKAKSTEGNMRTSIFTQAVGRTVRDNKDKLTYEEKEKISYYFKDYEMIGKEYEQNIADSTTKMMSSINNKKEFFEFILELGKKYPMSFIESFFDTTRGFWYICDKSFSNIEFYQMPGAFELYDTGIFRSGKYRIEHNSKLPLLKEVYNVLYCYNGYQFIPILYVFLQPGIYFYFALAFLLYAIYKNEKNTLVIAILLFVFYASCYMANCSIVRYMYPVMVSTPIMLALVEKNKKEEENE